MATGRRDVGEITQLIAAELRAAAARKSMTQARLSELSGIPLGTLSKILRGLAAIDIEQLYSLSTALGVDPFDVMAEAEWIRAGRRDGWIAPPGGRQAPPPASDGVAEPGAQDHPASASQFEQGRSDTRPARLPDAPPRSRRSKGSSAPKGSGAHRRGQQ